MQTNSMPPSERPNAIDSCLGADGTRLWKRVRRLEQDLGYSNIAFDLLPHTRTPTSAAGRPLPVDDRKYSRNHRKRRLSSIGSSTRYQSWDQHANCNGCTTALPIALLPDNNRATRWSRPSKGVTDLVNEGLRNVRTRPEHPNEPDEPSSSRSDKCNTPGSLDSRENLGLDGYTLQSPPPVHGPCHRRSGHSGEPEGSHCAGVEATTIDDSRCHCKDVRTSKVAAQQGRSGTSQPSSRLAVHDNTCAVQKGTQEEPSAWVGEVFELQINVGEGGTSFPAPSPGHKLRPVRAGTCRSLLSPMNPLTSNTVVARVKQGLQKGGDTHPKVLLVGSGTFNPVHKLHIRRFFLAKDFLEGRKGIRVVGGIVSPSHPTLVRQRHRVRAAEIIPPKHRLYMARAAVGEKSWLAVDPWEVTRKRIMDYMSVLEHAKEVCHETFPGHAGDITILYMCEASQIHHLNPALLRGGGFGVITVCRPLEKERLMKEISPNFRNLAIVVEDSAILSAELEKTSSTTVRHLLKQGKSVEGMVGKAVARYIRDNNIAERVSGKDKWTAEDKSFMFDQEDKKDRPYHNLPRVYVRRASQMPLQY